MQETEKWRPIPSLGGWYDASSLGGIRSWRVRGGRGRADLRADEPKILRGQVNADGYRMVSITAGGVVRQVPAHRLVAEAFYGPSDLHVDHINHDPLDNRAVNLRFVTRSENARDRKRSPRGYTFLEASGKFKAQIRVGYKTRHLGYFETEAEARAAFLAKYEEIHGCLPGERILPLNHPAHKAD